MDRICIPGPFVYSVYVKDNTFYEFVLFCKFLFSVLNPCHWDGLLGPQTGTQCSLNTIRLSFPKTQVSGLTVSRKYMLWLRELLLVQMGQRPPLTAELENLISQPYAEKQCGHDETEILRVLVRLFYSCTEASPSQRPTVMRVFSILSEISGPAPAPVDSPFVEKDPDETVKLQVTGPNILRSLASQNLEESLSLESDLQCSCGEKKCSKCEGPSATIANKRDPDSSLNMSQTQEAT